MKRPTSGFTLLEVLAAMVFLGILVPVLLQALTLSNRASVTADRSAMAVQLAENKLEELLLNDQWRTLSPNGEFGDDWPGYRWSLERQPWQAGRMTELTLTVAFEVQGREREVRLSTLVADQGVRP